jgi:hypothetical protein
MPIPHPVPTRRLPAQPSIEQLRKQAKELLEQYRASRPDTVREVNQFESEPDPAAFALGDAQRVLARAYGYESWPKLKAFVDGANVQRLAEAVKAGDLDQVRALLNARPGLVGMDMAGNNEHRALHYAVLRRDVPMVRLLMETGADARKGIFPHRDATSAFAIARDRDYTDVVTVIRDPASGAASQGGAELSERHGLAGAGANQPRDPRRPERSGHQSDRGGRIADSRVRP